MTSLASWLSPAATAALGWALLHFLWQGAALAALASALMGLSGRPATRYAIGMAALALMLAMPVGDFLLFAHGAPHALPSGADIRASFFARGVVPQSILPWLVQSWLAGVMLFALRFAGGFLLLEHRCRQSVEADGKMQALCKQVQRRLGLDRAIGYLECGWLEVPAAIGWLRPIILLPAMALTGLSETQIRALIAHELAHIRRWDYPANLFQILAETLLFYHPAVWWLNRRIRAERELCCDEIALSEAGDRAEYARALAVMAERAGASRMAVAATHGILSARILHILGRPDDRPGLAGMAGGLLFLIASMQAGYALLAFAAPVPVLYHHENGRMTSARPPGERVVAANVQRAGWPTVRESVVRNIAIRIASIQPLAEISKPRPRLVSPPAGMNQTFVVSQISASLPDVPLISVAHVTDAPQSAAARHLDLLTVADEQYPAPLIKLMGPFSWHEGPWAEALNYCRDFAAQTVTQGANRPIQVDDGVKQRLGFFYWHCMMSNGQMDGNLYFTAPPYLAIGSASPQNPVDASGNWTISVHADAPRNCTFTQSGNALAGTCTGREGNAAITGIVDGRQIRWVWKYTRDDELDFIGMVSADGAIAGQSILAKDLGDYSDHLQTFTAVPGVAKVASQN